MKISHAYKIMCKDIFTELHLMADSNILSVTSGALKRSDVETS
jgi:hypothetical protein